MKKRDLVKKVKKLTKKVEQLQSEIDQVNCCGCMHHNDKNSDELEVEKVREILEKFLPREEESADQVEK